STRNILLSVPLTDSWTWSVSGGQIAAVGAILALTAINYVGLREGAMVQNLLTLLKIGSIVAIVAWGLMSEAPETFSLAVSRPTGSLLAAFGVGMIAALWTYDGWYGPTFSAGEMRNPARHLPLGLILGTGIIMLLYLSINVVYFRALSVEAMAETPRIAETAAAVLFGSGAARLVSLAVVISTLGCLSATILYSPRIYLPMAQDGVFFRSLAHVHWRYRTPGRSLWAQSLWAVVLTLSGTYEQLYTYVVFAAVLFHVGTGAAVFVLRRRHPDAPRPYKVWGYPWVPLLFILALIVLVGNTLVEKPIESLLGLGLVALGVPAYVYWRRQRD
ncbi:MAG: APC family permease, partial [Acidobacteriota bacterium]|nr:APC family permease [Acidobacteriota bacterium]